MPEARRREVDKMLRGLTPKHQRQLSVSTSNALDRFAVIEAVLSHRKLVLLLDYDGTLTPIVNDPSKAVLSERVRAILRELPKHFITGVISGRSLGKIRDFVGVPGLFYAGSHGFDILAPSNPKSGLRSKSSSPVRPEHAKCHELSGREALSHENGHGVKTPPEESLPRACCCGQEEDDKDEQLGAATPPSPPTTALEGVAQDELSEKGVGSTGTCDVLEEVRHQVAAEYLPVMSTIRDQLIAELKDIERSEVEDNRFSISVHYRNCAREDVPKVRAIVMDVQSRHQRIRMGSGKEVFELQPDIAWDKGKAVLWLLDKLITAEDKASLITTTNTTTFPADAKKQGVGAAEASIDVSSTSASGHSTSGHGDDGEDGEQGFFTIFIGDDKTDENAFRVFSGEKHHGSALHEGLGILVSEESRETNAAYTLRNPDEVALFLEKIAHFSS